MAPKTKNKKGDTSDAADGRGAVGRDLGTGPVLASLGTSDELITPEMKKYRTMLGSNPASRIFATLAELYRKHGMYDEAIGMCLKGLKHHPGYLSGRVVLGLAYFDKGMLREAAEELEQVISAKPDHLMAARALGDVMLADGDIRQAEFYFNRVLSLAPDDPDVTRKLETLAPRAEREAAPVPIPVPIDPDPGDEVLPPDEILEGEGLEIVEDGGTPPGIPVGDIAAHAGGIDLSVDEMSDILVKTGLRDTRGRMPRTQLPAAGTTPETDATAAAAGLPPLHRAIERLQIGIVITDLDGTVHFANRSAIESHGWAGEDPIGRNIRDFFPPGLFQPMTMHEILDKKSLAKDTVNVRKDGSVFPVRITYDIVDGESKLPAYIIVGIDDLSRHIDVDEDLWQLSIKDAETGLFNRRHFLVKIAEESKRAERIGYPLCLMVITVDNLKSYQATNEAKKGQRVTAEMGKIARQSIRKELDSAYRLTEDEFAVILPTATDQKALIVAKRLTDKVAKRLPGVEIRIGTASRQDRQSIEDLIDAAEKAIYRESTPPQG
jgi:diguanylate cyclase (GGDEF)-like protein/PAS domain S-box-containing protein